jgi:selenocysteine-specific elongation factor
MRSQSFDAVIRSSLKNEWGSQGMLVYAAGSIRADLHPYFEASQEDGEVHYVQILPAQPLDMRWGDKIELRTPDGAELWGRGEVLFPAATRVSRRAQGRRVDYLMALNGGEKEMLYALTEHKGVKGLSGGEISEFSNISEKALRMRAQELESEGRIKILSFEPLYLLAESSFDFLCARLLNFVESQHRSKPDLLGISSKSLRARFRLPQRVHQLALKAMERDGHIRWLEDRVIPGALEITVSPEEEKMLAELEDLSLKGELKRVPLDTIRRRFRISSAKWDKLLMLLTEREKVIQGQDGFLIHSQWLDEIVAQIRSLGRNEISIAEFKSLTGLSRKYAIPLLELLDQLGITRRKGSIREIL